MPELEPACIVDEAITSRRSVRAFLPTPVPQEVLEDLLRVAARAPSGTNMQPWRVYVLTGGSRERLAQEIVETYLDPEQAAEHKEEYSYYPNTWSEPYLSRRRKVGYDLYQLLEIEKGDKERMREQHARNFKFFDAPVGMIFTIERSLEQGSWLDYGMFLQNLMVAARGRGLHTCPQAAFTQFHRIIARHLKLPPEEQVVCGMSLGYEDPSQVENSLVTERAEVSAFTVFLD
ncbi:MAG: nitroreductase [bacterium]|jgi:nitroreductase